MHLESLTQKWHGVPVWIWAFGASLVLYLGYRYYKGRSTTATATPAATTTAATDTSGANTPVQYGGGGGSGISPYWQGDTTTPQTDAIVTGTGNPLGSVTTDPGTPNIATSKTVSSKAKITPATPAVKTGASIIAGAANASAASTVPKSGGILGAVATSVNTTAANPVPKKPAVAVKTPPKPVSAYNSTKPNSLH